MGFFKFSKKKNVIDLTEGFKNQVKTETQKQNLQNLQDNPQDNSDGVLNFLGNMSASSSMNSPLSETAEMDERRKKLIKRLTDMTTRIEDLSNQIYHLQQRIELLEKKADVNRF